MISSESLQDKLQKAAIPVFCALALAYFGYHALEGNHGLHAYARLTEKAQDLRQQAAKVAAERAALEHQVSLMRPEHIDPDMLDEQVRSQLGYAHQDDVIILQKR